MSEKKEKVTIMKVLYCDFFYDTLLESVVCNVNSVWSETLKINSKKVSFKTDTVAQANILPVTKFNDLKNNVKLKKANKISKSYTSHNLKVIGTCTLPLCLVIN